MSGCHDTTLAGVLSSLGAFDGEKWPPYTSHLAVELFRIDSEISTSSQPSSSQSQRKPQMLSWGGTKRNESTQGGIARKKLDDLSEAEREKIKGYYVRLRYNDRPMTIPGCKLPGKHLEGNAGFCTLVSPVLSFPSVEAKERLRRSRKPSKPYATSSHPGTGKKPVIRTWTSRAFRRKTRMRVMNRCRYDSGRSSIDRR